MKLYKILTDEGIIINSKNITFLNYIPCSKSPSINDDLIIKERIVPEAAEKGRPEGEDGIINVEEEDTEDLSSDKGGKEGEIYELTEDSDTKDDDNVANSLIPAPAVPTGRLLRD
jgi:hypothetical protein